MELDGQIAFPPIRTESSQELAVRVETSYNIQHLEVVMDWDVKTVRPLDDYHVFVELEDGRQGVFDIKPYLDHGVFKELRDKSYFDRVGVVLGAVTWPHEQDIAPETLIAGLKPATESEETLTSPAPGG